MESNARYKGLNYLRANRIDDTDNHACWNVNIYCTSKIVIVLCTEVESIKKGLKEVSVFLTVALVDTSGVFVFYKLLIVLCLLFEVCCVG